MLPHRSPPSSGASRKRHLILVVEDTVDSRELYADYLTYAGFDVVTALNGREAVRLARKLNPDLVLMDIRLPGVDGLQATADLKADPHLARIPIVAMTADPSVEITERALAAGCAAFIPKPALPDVVAREIRQILSDVEDAERRPAL